MKAILSKKELKRTLKKLARQGYFRVVRDEATGEERYQLTEKGEQAVQASVDVDQTSLSA